MIIITVSEFACGISATTVDNATSANVTSSTEPPITTVSLQSTSNHSVTSLPASSPQRGDTSIFSTTRKTSVKPTTTNQNSTSSANNQTSATSPETRLTASNRDNSTTIVTPGQNHSTNDKTTIITNGRSTYDKPKQQHDNCRQYDNATIVDYKIKRQFYNSRKDNTSYPFKVYRDNRSDDISIWIHVTTPGSNTVKPTGNTSNSSPSATTSGVTTGSTKATSSEPAKTTVATTTETSPKTTVTTAAPTTSTTTATPIIVCPEKPCPAESVCLNSTCACVAGSYLNEGNCVKGQVFPGQLRVVSLNYSNEMSDRASAVFQKTAAQISAQLYEILKDQPGYVRSDVIKLVKGSVIATVDNIYKDTNVTQTDVNKAIDQAITSSLSNNILSGATYNAANLCDSSVSPCDFSTTSCTPVKGQPICSCLAGYISINQLYSNNKSCQACPSGQRAVGNTCQPCSFGYSGFNCNDSSLLAVVVISCVLGGILLLLILFLIAFCCWKGCSSKSDSNFESPYSISNLNQSWPTDVPPIPRANTHWEAAGPSFEMTEGGSTNALVDKKNHTNGLLNPKGWKKTGSYDLQPDDMKTFKGQNTSRSGNRTRDLISSKISKSKSYHPVSFGSVSFGWGRRRGRGAALDPSHFIMCARPHLMRYGRSPPLHPLVDRCTNRSATAPPL
ncbi:hypothetical protein WMY93_002321 [Mugilogobius chulae]|uniref:SEA domain-containing protein n=1 Tax=Mugilogobius chulae TaxID=88201 RepID=A0AAW0PU08_9GOBI